MIKYFTHTYLFAVLISIVAYFTANSKEYIGILKEANLKPEHILSSFIIFFLVICIWGLIWREIVHDLTATRLTVRESLFIHLKSWIGKYLPAKAGLALAKIYFAREKGVSLKAAAISTLYENSLSLMASLVLAVPIVLYYYPFADEVYANRLVFVTTGLILFTGLTPKVMSTIVNLGLKTLKRPLIPKEFFLGSKTVIKYILFFSLSYFLSGLSFFFAIRAVHFVSVDSLAQLTGIVTFAGMAGMVAFFAPSGIGVREGIIVLLLKELIPLPVAILVSLLFRVILTAVDLFILLLVFTAGKNRSL